jgi:hypothetical protein
MLASVLPVRYAEGEAGSFFGWQDNSMIHIKQYVGRWYIIRNVGMVQSQSLPSEQTGSSRERDIEEYWTGDGWDDQMRFGQSFNTLQAAEAYLQAKSESMG